MSTRRRTLGVWASPAPKGANGERLCRNCHGPMPADKRKHNCSSKCSEEWSCKTSPSHLRYVLKRRDKGICAICGLDTDALKAAVDYVRELAYRKVIPWETFGAFRVATKTTRWPGDLWDADHIVPVIEGGGECGLDNYRTLCVPCHKRVTAELRKRLAKPKPERPVRPASTARQEELFR